MKYLKILINSFLLLVVNMIGIIVGFMIYKLFRTSDQISIQLPVAIVISILLFLFWNFLLHYINTLQKISLCKISDFVWTVIISLLFGPLIFIPIHYLTQGYLTSSGNIIALILFQIPVNTITVIITLYITHRVSHDRSIKCSPGL